jgi:hypothetical protein
VGHAILAQVACGNAVTITLTHGGTLTLVDLAQSLRLLRTRFGWEPGVPRSEASAVPPLRPRFDQAAAHLFDMCQRMGRQFTMQGILARMFNEQPGMVFQFAELWARLISHQLVKVNQSGEINTYEVTGRHRY